MKRVTLCLLVTFMIFVMLTPFYAQRKKIELWCTDKEVAGLEPVAKQFRRDKKIEVEIVVQAEVRSKYKQAAIAKTGPDIVVGAHDWVGELAKNGVISEINISDKDKAQYWPVSIEGFTYNGKLYGIPYCVEALVLFYNKKLIPEAPKTWEELLVKAKALTKDGKYGFLYHIDNNFYPNFPFVGSQGGYVFKWDRANGRFDVLDCGLDTPGAIEGFKFINRLVQEGVVPASTNIGIVISTFKEGKCAIVMDGPWNTKDYVDNMGKDVVGISKLPTLNGKKSVPFVGARGFMVNSASNSRDAALEFILKYAGTKDGQYSMYKAGGRPPAHIEACNMAMKEDIYAKAVVESVNDGVPMPNVKAMSVVFNYAAGIVDKFKTGEQTVENAVKTGVNSIRQEISDKKARYD